MVSGATANALAEVSIRFARFAESGGFRCESFVVRRFIAVSSGMVGNKLPYYKPKVSAIHFYGRMTKEIGK